MLGFVNKAIEAFVCQRYGGKLWADLLIDLSLPGYEFEAMLTYEDGITYDLIDRLAKRQSKIHHGLRGVAAHPALHGTCNLCHNTR